MHGFVLFKVKNCFNRVLHLHCIGKQGQSATKINHFDKRQCRNRN